MLPRSRAVTPKRLCGFLIGGLPAATGRKMHFTGLTVLKVIDGKIVGRMSPQDVIARVSTALETVAA